jgi:uncharacterized Zn-finger protein
MSWNCEVCKKSFTRKQSLERHLSTTNVHDKYNESIKTYDCECGKIYKHKQSLRNHKIKCEKAIKSAEAKISEVYEQRLKTQKAEFDKERTELRNQIAMLLDKHAGNTTNNTHGKIQIQSKKGVKKRNTKEGVITKRRKMSVNESTKMGHKKSL